MFRLARRKPDRIPVDKSVFARAAGRLGAQGGGGGHDGEGDFVSEGVLNVCAEFGGWIWNVDDPQGTLYEALSY
jgi:hypothetical protein